MSKRTWQPKKLKRLRDQGFLTRLSSKSGKDMISRRRSKGRHRLAVTVSSK